MQQPLPPEQTAAPTITHADDDRPGQGIVTLAAWLRRLDRLRQSGQMDGRQPAARLLTIPPALAG
jgi:hypothetical protein